MQTEKQQTGTAAESTEREQRRGAEPSASQRSQAFDGWALLAALCDLAFQPLSASVTQKNMHARGEGGGSTNSTNNIQHKRGDEEM